MFGMHCTCHSKPQVKFWGGGGGGVMSCYDIPPPPPPPQNEIEFRGGCGGGGGCVCLWTSLQPFLGHFTFKRITNVCLHISCDDITNPVMLYQDISETTGLPLYQVKLYWIYRVGAIKNGPFPVIVN